MLPTVARKIEFYKNGDAVWLRTIDPLDKWSIVDRPAKPHDINTYTNEYSIFANAPTTTANDKDEPRPLKHADAQRLNELEHRVALLEDRINRLGKLFVSLAAHQNHLVGANIISYVNAPLFMFSFVDFEKDFSELQAIVSGKLKVNTD